jgi:hypothetical protein
MVELPLCKREVGGSSPSSSTISCKVCDGCILDHYESNGRPRCIYGGPYSGYDGESSNGRTEDFESPNLGSNPSSPSKE